MPPYRKVLGNRVAAVAKCLAVSTHSERTGAGSNLGSALLIALRRCFIYTNDYFFDFGFLFHTNVKAPESRGTLFLALMPGRGMGVRFPRAMIPGARCIRFYTRMKYFSSLYVYRCSRH
jgi:hypothetical protein